MQIVIEMTEHEHEVALRDGWIHSYYSEKIKNGIVLPKGHGDLKDVGKIVLDKFIDTEIYSRSSRFSVDYKKGYNGAIDDVVRVLVNAATIVEADEEVDDVRKSD